MADVPERFGEYRVVRALGAGAMGQVYLAHDTLLDRPVAIKLPRLPDDESRARALAEARAIARIVHPNVAAVHRVGEVAGKPYIVTEYVAGRPLDRVERPLEIAEVLRIGVGLARGLGAAHRRGVLHRDVKPANVVLTPERDPKLVDFGLADLGTPAPRARPAARHDDLETTQRAAPRRTEGDEATVSPERGPIVGTPLYMAPELFDGLSCTRQSDVYALGAVLYELAAGKAPHEGATYDALSHAKRSAATPLATALGGAAGGPRHQLCAVVDRCLAVSPAERFAGADDVADALCQDATARAAERESPYVGLRAFEAEDAGVFFGREEDLRELVDRLRVEPLVVVAGDSGVGKSSLVRAGLLPAVAGGALGGAAATALVRPGSHPEAAIDDAVRGLGSARPAVLAVDQLEEIFAAGDAEAATRVWERLCAIALSGVRVVCTLRADFLGRLAGLPGAAAHLSRSLVLLGPPGLAGIERAIVAPAAAAGVRFAGATVDALRDALARDGASLPLLQFALAALWEGRDRTAGLIPADALDRLGGVAGALSRHADRVLEGLRPAERLAARRLLVALVTSEGARRRVGAQALVGAPPRPEARAALESLVRGRLVVAHEASGEGGYELIHEALLHGWDTLRGWLAAEAGDKVALERLERAAGEWVRLARAPGALLPPVVLGELAAVDPAQLPADAAALLVASRRAALRRTWSRRALVALVPAAALALWAGLEQRAASERALAVSRLVHEAGELERTAADARAQGQAGETRANEAFSRGEAEPGEAAWAGALAARALAEDASARAAGLFEQALAIDPMAPALHDRLAGILQARALDARARRAEVSSELRARLAAHDRSGRLLAALDAPGRLVVTPTPAAHVVVSRVERQGARLVERPAAEGSSPLSASLAAGSYVVHLSVQGRPAVRLPVLVEAGQALAVAPPLPERVPEGFVHVPAGAFLAGSADEPLRRGFFRTRPLHASRTEAFHVARHEITFGEWIAFLEALPPAERARRLPAAGTASPGAGAGNGLRLEPSPEGYALWLRTTTRPLFARAGERLRYPGRTRRAEVAWGRLPVAGISLEDVRAYAAWLDRTGKVPGARPCTGDEWERVARGADGRPFPGGLELEPDDADFDVTYGRVAGAYGPDEVGSHPASASPFGVEDLAGNVWEWTTAGAEGQIRGGSWYQDATSARAENREPAHPSMRDTLIGGRLCATPR